MPTCSNCKCQKDALDFYRNPRANSGLQSRCKCCTKNAAISSYRKNPAPTIARANQRERMLNIRTPPWADLSEIRRIYKEAKALSATGESYHVDHIVPITNPFVCGLHTETNLQILTAQDNMRKGNKFI